MSSRPDVSGTRIFAPEPRIVGWLHHLSGEWFPLDPGHNPPDYTVHESWITIYEGDPRAR
jgi:hypothetical protein